MKKSEINAYLNKLINEFEENGWCTNYNYAQDQVNKNLIDGSDCMYDCGRYDLLLEIKKKINSKTYDEIMDICQEVSSIKVDGIFYYVYYVVAEEYLDKEERYFKVFTLEDEYIKEMTEFYIKDLANREDVKFYIEQEV